MRNSQDLEKDHAINRDNMTPVSLCQFYGVQGLEYPDIPTDLLRVNQGPTAAKHLDPLLYSSGGGLMAMGVVAKGFDLEDNLVTSASTTVTASADLGGTSYEENNFEKGRFLCSLALPMLTLVLPCCR